MAGFPDGSHWEKYFQLRKRMDQPQFSYTAPIEVDLSFTYLK